MADVKRPVARVVFEDDENGSRIAIDVPYGSNMGIAFDAANAIMDMMWDRGSDESDEGGGDNAQPLVH